MVSVSVDSTTFYVLYVQQKNAGMAASKQTRAERRGLAGDRGSAVPQAVAGCESAWNKAPVLGVIGVQSPPGLGSHWLSWEHGSLIWDADRGDDFEDPPGLFCAEEANQGDWPECESARGFNAYRRTNHPINLGFMGSRRDADSQ